MYRTLSQLALVVTPSIVDEGPSRNWNVWAEHINYTHDSIVPWNF